MKTENKKYLIYGGVAFLVGSLGYFIYTTLRNKNSNVAESQTDTVTPETETTSGTNTFRDMLDNPTIPSGIDWKFTPIEFKPIEYNPIFKPFTTKSVLL
jgi:hypothetical protein